VDFFGVKPDGACSSDWDTKRFFFPEDHLHRFTVCINVLFSMRTHRSVTAILCSGKFSSIYAVYEVMCLNCRSFYCAILMENTHTYLGEFLSVLSMAVSILTSEI